MRLGLGTAQFGTDYGVSNVTGRTPQSEVRNILDVAAAGGIEVVDTAVAYGDAEAVLGRALAEGPSTFRIVTKLPPGATADKADAQVRASLSRLHVDSVAGLLAHRPADLLGPDGARLWRQLERARDAGLVERIGASVYTGEEIDALLQRFPIQLIQAPANVFDQRLLASGRLHHLRETGVEVHLRSAFLQGLLLMDPEGTPARFEEWRPMLRAYHRWAQEHGWTPLQAAVGFAFGLPADIVIVGVNDAAQLSEIVAAARPLDPVEFAQWASRDTALVDPSTWRS
jgi:aryl-alcohol dehydrogenase-like predicted oxidoreductase